MAMLSSPPPLRAGDIHPPPPLVHSTTTTPQLVTNCQLPHQRHPIHLSEKINHFCQLKNLTGALTLLRDSPSELTETAKATGILLQACGGEKDIETGRKVHHLVSSSTHLRNNVILNTQIITMYSVCGYPSDSRLAFEQLEEKNLYQWNAIISGYIRNDLWYDAIFVFCELLQTGNTPDNFTFPCVIKACIGGSNLRCGQVVQGLAVKIGLISDVFVGNSLVAMYGKFGFVDDAIKVFDQMPQRNLVTWNSLISGFSENGFSQKSIHLFMEFMILEDNLTPDVATLVTLLPVCASERDVLLGKTIHSLSVKLGLYHDLKVQNALMDMYLKNGYMVEAHTIHDKIKNKNVVSWNSIIWGYSEQGDFKHTFELLCKMQMENIKPDQVTILNVLKVCSHQLHISKVKEIHGYSIRHGIDSNELVANAFITAYSKHRSSFHLGENIFNRMNNTTVSSWNTLINSYTQNGDHSKATDLYIKMTSFGVDPDLYTISSLLLAFTELKLLNSGKEIHGFVVRKGLETDSHIGNSLISFYIQCEKPSFAKFVFDRLKDKNLVSWNSIIAGYSQNKQPNEALNLFRKMAFSGTHPYEIAITGALSACSQLSVLKLGQSIHSFALKKNLISDVFVLSSIIDMYSKTGCIKAARNVFDRSDKQHVGLWNVLIAGYAIHGQGNESIKLFSEMQNFGIKHDHFTFVAILMACNHGGLVKEGLEFYNEMQTVYKVDPKVEHYACLIDMLGRAGHFDDAMMIINKMHEEPDARIWSSLLSSCRIHGNLELGKEVVKKLLTLEPSKVENYILSSNLFASLKKWDDVKMIREKMKKVGVKKEAGCSWIEIEGKVYNFLAGDNEAHEL